MLYAHCLTAAEVREAVLLDYGRVAGLIVLASRVIVDNDTEMLPVFCNPVVVARIVPFGSSPEWREALFNWKAKAFCVPKYRVDILEHHPTLTDAETTWVYGKSRSTMGNVIPESFRIASPRLQLRYAGVPAVTPAGQAPPVNHQEFRRLV